MSTLRRIDDRLFARSLGPREQEALRMVEGDRRHGVWSSRVFGAAANEPC